MAIYEGYLYTLLPWQTHNIAQTDILHLETADQRILVLYCNMITVGERTVALKIIARFSITQTPTGQWNIDNFAV